MNAMPAKWIAVDWGTSNVRAWVFDAEGHVVANPSSDDGMGSLSRDGFELALLALVAPFLPESGRVPVICCGMAGARQGWIEAPYAWVPCGVLETGKAVQPTVRDPRLDVRILPGVAQSVTPDVMRGEETQLGGFISLHPTFDGVVCLPGTHTKWAQVNAGKIVSFRTFMTGELFALLSAHSVLRISVGTDGWDAPAFLNAVGEAISSPQNLTSALFSLRAGSLLDAKPPKVSRARLSGLILGQELAGAQRYWQDQQVAIIGNDQLLELYGSALASQGVDVIRYEGDELVLAGLQAAYDSMRELH